MYPFIKHDQLPGALVDGDVVGPAAVVVVVGTTKVDETSE